MGANAQTSVPTFTAGQVLTAAQLNESARTGVPVAADASARDGLFGGTGEKTLAEGQLVYLEDSNVVQYYDGSSWATLGPSSPGGLVYLTGAAFTTVTSFSLPNDTFTATYRNYRMMLNITAVTADSDFTLRLRASGSDITSSQYVNVLWGVDSNATSGATGNAGQSSGNAGEQDGPGAVRYTLTADIMQPKEAAPTNIHLTYAYVNKAGTTVNFRQGLVQYDQATAADSLSFISSVASSITGNYRVYGYSDS